MNGLNFTEPIAKSQLQNSSYAPAYRQAGHRFGLLSAKFRTALGKTGF